MEREGSVGIVRRRAWGAWSVGCVVLCAVVWLQRQADYRTQQQAGGSLAGLPFQLGAGQWVTGGVASVLGERVVWVGGEQDKAAQAQERHEQAHSQAPPSGSPSPTRSPPPLLPPPSPTPSPSPSRSLPPFPSTFQSQPTPQPEQRPTAPSEGLTLSEGTADGSANEELAREIANFVSSTSSRICPGVPCSDVKQLLTDRPDVLDHHALLIHTLSQCCSPHSPDIAASIVRSGKRPPPITDHFAEFVDPSQLFPKLHQEGGPAVIWVETRVCEVLEADRSRFHRDFVLVGPFHQKAVGAVIGGQGAVSGGPYGNGFPSMWVEGSLQGHTRLRDGRKILGLWVSIYLTETCGPGTIGRLMDLLDDPRMKGWFVHQGGFMVQEPGSTEWKPHPKIISLPLGPKFKIGLLAKEALAWVKSHRPATRHLMAPWMSSTRTVRSYMFEQFKRLYPDANDRDDKRSSELANNGVVKDQLKLNVYAANLAKSAFIVSPPGLGPDCYRHWEALIAGCFPIVSEGLGLDRSLQDAPSVTVDDLSAATPHALQEHAQRMNDFVKANWLTQLDNTELSPLFLPYWNRLIRDVATGRVVAGEWMDRKDHVQGNLHTSPELPHHFQDFVEAEMRPPARWQQWMVDSRDLTYSPTIRRAYERAKTRATEIPWDEE